MSCCFLFFFFFKKNLVSFLVSGLTCRRAYLNGALIRVDGGASLVAKI